MSGFLKKTLLFFGFSDDENVKSYKVEKIGRNGPEERKKIIEGNKRGLSSRQKNSSRRKISLESQEKIEARSKVFVAEPLEFEEVQIIADSFKKEIPIIVNLQKVDQDTSKRIIDFCGGLTYALEGSIKKVAEKVFLIIPYNVEVNSKEKEKLIEESLHDPEWDPE